MHVFMFSQGPPLPSRSWSLGLFLIYRKDFSNGRVEKILLNFSWEFQLKKKKWYFCMLCSLMFSYIKFIIVFYPFSFSSTGVRFFSLIYVKHKRIVSGKELKEDFFQGLLIFWLNIEKTVRFFKFWQKRGWTQREEGLL